MAIKAQHMNVDMKGTYADVSKTMAADPRRISKVEVHVILPCMADDKTKAILENTAKTCPVIYCLHLDIDVSMTFNWS